MIALVTAATMAFAPLAIQAAPSGTAPAPVSPEALSVQNAALVRCSAAFALVSYAQENGDKDARKWPQIDPRGREFFVRALAQVMDDTGLDRDAVAALVQAEAQRLLEQSQVDEVMPACLLMLDASGV